MKVICFVLIGMAGVHASCLNSRDDSSFPCHDARGGAALMVQIPHQSPLPKLPVIDLQHLSLVLRYTCEMNRRLQETSQGSHFVHDDLSGFDSPQQVHVHPSQQWHPPIRPTASESEEITLFHAISPRSKRRGVSRWGPDLHKYLEFVTDALGVRENPLVLACAVIYLDRASSVETHRPNGAMACPFCSPRTVHRLVLISLIMATKRVLGSVNLDQLKGLGLSNAQLEKMEMWMRASLGEQGVTISSEQLQNFFQTWDRTWNKPKIRAATRKTRSLIKPHPAAFTHPVSEFTSTECAPPSMGGTAETALSCWS